MNRHALLALLLVHCCWCVFVPAVSAASLLKNYLVAKWEAEDGLPENSLRAMVQTRDGALWLGTTSSGLARFDGVKFAAYDQSNTPGLPSDGIINLYLDANRRLWVSTVRGLVVAEAESLSNLKPEPRWTGNYIRTVAENAGVLCLTSFEGKVFRATAGQFDELPHPPGDPRHTHFGHVDATGRIWIAHQEFIGYWDGQKWQAWQPPGTKTADFRAAGQAHDGSWIVVLGTDLFRLEGEQIKSQLELSLPVPAAWQLTEDHAGRIWLPTPGSGLYSIATNGAVSQATTATGLIHDSLRFVFEDKEENLWVGSSGGGLLRLRERAFQNFGLPTGLGEPIVKAVVEEEPGKLLVGTYGNGVARYEEGKEFLAKADFDGPAGALVQCLLKDRQGRIWMGTFGDGIHLFASGQHRQFSTPDLGGNNVNAIFQDSRGRIWAGGNQTTALFADDKFTPQPAGNGAPSEVLCFAESPATHELFAGTLKGVYHLVGDAWQELKDASGRTLPAVAALRFEGDGTMWLGTSGSGLKRFKAGKWSTIAETNGLPGTKISALLEDDFGNWWLGSNRGIVRTTRADLERVADGLLAALPCQIYTRSDGLAGVECASGYQTTALKDSSGRLWFAMNKGVAMVDPRYLRINTNPPPVYIERVRTEDTSGVRKHALVTANEPAIVPAGTREFTAYITALSYSAPEKMRFAYRLEGIDKAWRELNGRAVFLYPVPPGNYHLRVKASNNDGIWNETGATLAFTVQPFFWQTWFFRGGMALLALGGVGGTVWRVQQNRLRRNRELLAHERALAQEKARLASVLESTPDYVGFASSNGSIFYINPAGRRMIGLTLEEDVTKLQMRELHPAATNELHEHTAFPQAIRTGTWSGETVMKRRDGRELPVSQVIVAHKDAEGRLLFLSTIIRDISEQRRAQEAVERSETALRAFMDALPTPAVLLDRDGTFVAVNEALAQEFGKSRAELIGQIAYTLWPPELAAARKAGIDGVFASGREASFEDSNGGRHFINYVSPVQDATGGVSRVAVLALDITERKLAEEGLARSEELFRAIVEDQSEMIVRWRPDGTITFVNQAFCRVFNETYEELVDTSFYPFIREEYHAATRKRIAALTPDSPLTTEVRESITPRGEILWQEWTDRGLFDAQGRLVELQSTGRDITERRRAEQELHRSEERLRQAQKVEAIGTLAGGIAHDFNNILSAIMAYTELARMDAAEDLRVQASLVEVSKAAERARDLVKQILAFSRQHTQERRPINLQPVVNEALKLLRSTIPTTIEIITEVQLKAGAVLADPSQIHQVLMNLCTNAAHAIGPKPGRIEVRLVPFLADEMLVQALPDLRTGQYVRLSVSDTGHGMSAETTKRIFDPFFTTKEPGQGTGLGLAVVHGIIKGHDGAIQVYSESGVGSVFHIYLPALAAAVVEPAPKPPTILSVGNGERIMIVDDEPAICDVTRRILTRLQYQVTTCTHPKEALTRYQSQPDGWDLVITDLSMPGMMGTDLATELLKLNPRQRIVLATGFGGHWTTEKAQQLGILDLVQKPIPPAVLAEAVRRWLTCNVPMAGEK